MQPWKAAGEKRDDALPADTDHTEDQAALPRRAPQGRTPGVMTHYQQTLIIPRTKQRFPAEPRRDGRQAYRPQTGNNINRELNSILAFFD